MAAAASFDADATRHGGAGRAALGVHAASRKIGKPGAGHGQQERKPVIIYMVSPKVIHVEAHEFLPLVQRLTGPESGGDKKSSKPSTSGGGAAGSSSPREESEGARSKSRAAAPPVRVKARALNRPAGGRAMSVSVTATQQQQAAAASPLGLMFRDLSPLRGAALKGEHHHPLVSPGWLHHVGDHHFLSPAGAASTLGSPSASFLDIFGPLSSSQQQ